MIKAVVIYLFIIAQSFGETSTCKSQAMAAVSEDGKIMILNAKKKGLRKLIYPRPSLKDPSDEAYTWLGWSKNCSRLWFGVGVTGGWSHLVLYNNDKIQIFNISGFNGEKIQPDEGWMTISTAPRGDGDAASTADFTQKKSEATLAVLNILSGKKIQLAKALGEYFGERWNSSGDLEFSLNGRKTKVTKKDLKQRLSQH